MLKQNSFIKQDVRWMSKMFGSKAENNFGRLQLARQTGRDIMHAYISEVRSAWVGE